MKLARFYRDGELSEIRFSNSDEAVFEVKNLFASELLDEDAIQDMIATKNSGQMSHVDELRLDFNRICRRRDIHQMTRLGFYKLKDSSECNNKFSVETVLNIKNEQRYLSACFSDYMILKRRFSTKKSPEPLLLASLKNGYFYLLNADELPPSNPILQSVKNAFAWIQKKDFFKDVYQVVRLIPIGRVSSYGAIAKFLGAAKSSRVVGYAMNASHNQIKPVPAHRVVNRNGMLSGKSHFSSPTAMEEALKKEGILVKNDCVIHFKKIFWDPTIELDLI